MRVSAPGKIQIRICKLQIPLKRRETDPSLATPKEIRDSWDPVKQKLRELDELKQARELGEVTITYRQFLIGIQVPVGDAKADAEQLKLAKEASAVRKEQMAERVKALKDWDKLQVTERNIPDPGDKTAYSTFMDGYSDLQGYEISYDSMRAFRETVSVSQPRRADLP
jgi:hypothetical protein